MRLFPSFPIGRRFFFCFGVSELRLCTDTEHQFTEHQSMEHQSMEHQSMEHLCMVCHVFFSFFFFLFFPFPFFFFFFFFLFLVTFRFRLICTSIGAPPVIATNPAAALAADAADGVIDGHSFGRPVAQPMGNSFFLPALYFVTYGFRIRRSFGFFVMQCLSVFVLLQFLFP